MRELTLLRDILTAPVITISSDRSVKEALHLMRSRRISSLIVMTQGEPVGIMTERDAVLVAFRHQNPEAICVGDVMGKPLVTASADLEYWLFLNKQGKSPMVLRNSLKMVFSLKTSPHISSTSHEINFRDLKAA